MKYQRNLQYPSQGTHQLILQTESSRDRRVFPRYIPRENPSGIPSNNSTKYPSQVQTIKQLSATSYSPTNVPFINTRNMPREMPRGDPTGDPITVPTEQPSANLRARPISEPGAIKRGIQEEQVSIQRIIILLTIHTISPFYSRQRATRTRQ